MLKLLPKLCQQLAKDMPMLIPYVSNIPAMIVELKRNQPTGAALQQIETKQYFNVMDKYRMYNETARGKVKRDVLSAVCPKFG